MRWGVGRKCRRGRRRWGACMRTGADGDGQRRAVTDRVGRSRAGSVAFAALLVAGTAAGQQTGLNVKRYEYWLITPVPTPSISGLAVITLNPHATSDTILTLNLVGMNVDFVEGASGRRVHSYDGTKLSIRIAPTDTQVRIQYHGKPLDGLIVGRNAHDRSTAFGDNWPQRARYWLPSVDDPGDKASVAFIVTTPPAWKIIANGIL